LFSILIFAAAMSGAAIGENAPPLSCPPTDASVAAANALYSALPERVEDDPTPVDDLLFMQALAEPRGENDAAVVWRRRPPSYAFSALADAQEASCAAAFDVAASGRTINIAVSCTDIRFEAEVRRSVSAMLFLPKRENSVAVAARRLVQPYSFCLDD